LWPKQQKGIGVQAEEPVNIKAFSAAIFIFIKREERTIGS
jgi:hypothetical protein